jgi:AcrR family transcriptional regulator
LLQVALSYSSGVATEARSYRGLSADERRAERRARLVEAAIDLFGTRGYNATTIQEICAAAGVTARHFYEAFAQRETLLLAAYEASVEGHLATVRETLEAAAPERRVRAGIAAALETWAADERRARIAFLEIVGVSDAVEARRRAVIERYAAFVASELRAVSGTRRDFTWAARALTAATIGTIEAWLALPAGERPPVRRLVDELELLYVAAVRGRSAAASG